MSDKKTEHQNQESKDTAEKSSFAKASEDKQPNIDNLKRELDECKKLKDEYLNGWQRARADLLNYQKEEIERTEGLIVFIDGALALKILPILDNFDIIEKNLPKDLQENENVKGVMQLKIQILDLLKSLKVEEIKSLGEKFDPNIHEAIGEAEEKDKEPGTIIEEIQKGYKINNSLLRPAKVKVTK